MSEIDQLRSEVHGLREELRVFIAKLDGQNLLDRVDRHDHRLTKLESFQFKIIGAIAAAGCAGGGVAALLQVLGG